MHQPERSSRSLLLNDVLVRLRGAGLLEATTGPAEQAPLEVVTNDSRHIGANTLFVAITGGKADGHLFIDKAVQDGATVVICQKVPTDAERVFPKVTFLRVTSPRSALAEVGALYYGEPARHLEMVGVTGTNGKTTTTFLIQRMLETLGVKTGLMGTVWLILGGAPIEATLTTPDSLDVHRMLREMVDAGCGACAMEVSSHALDQDRVRAIGYDVAIFMNLTQDHLDYHGTIEKYAAAKKRLFDGLTGEAMALFNLDDPAGPGMVADTSARVVSFGQSANADIRIEVLENVVAGLRLRIDGSERRFRLVGLFNAYNLAAAYGAGRALGYGREEVLDALAAAPPVPGRFEQMHFADGTTAVVDYAHTPDALENVLQTIRETRPADATLWCVFGCGGDRDPTKRPLMGAIAEQYADRLIVTSDNPRTEDPIAILNDIRKGMRYPDRAEWIVNRKEALAHVADQAAPGDVILVAGKGHETYQIVGTTKYPFDDRSELQAAFDAKLQTSKP